MRLASAATILVFSADSTLTKASRDYFNDLVTGSTVTIKRITEDCMWKNSPEFFKAPMNIQEHLVEKDLACIYERYSD